MDEYAHAAYKITKSFPKDELFGITSQLRRAALSVILNYIEGYARRKNKVNTNFLEISYGSLQESKYLIKFSLEEQYLSTDEYEKLFKLSEEIAAMLWSTLSNKETDRYVLRD